jgi:hypothetical protein
VLLIRKSNACAGFDATTEKIISTCIYVISNAKRRSSGEDNELQFCNYKYIKIHFCISRPERAREKHSRETAGVGDNGARGKKEAGP